ncbi:MAG: serine--tRNA ligase [Spirochaetes bacterium]|nr:serine--tRNA ligase [Spirochaetota bacterium]
MIDIKKLRENPNYFKEGARKKHFEVDIDSILKLDETRRSIQASVDSRRRELGDKSGAMKSASSAERKALQAELKDFSRAIKEDEGRMRDIDERRNELLLLVPNPPMDDVPEGRDESDNVEIRRVGEPPKFSFTPKDHLDLGLQHDLFDVERGAKVSGSRCYFLKNEAVLLENAIMRYALDFLTERGFTPFTTPVFVREEAMVGTGYFPTGREESYAIERDELYLIGTSEVTLVSYHSDEILAGDELPLKYTGITTCFRREAGSYGKDVRGLYRVHQFQKVEQVIICRDDWDEMLKIHDEILTNSEQILRNFGIPYRVVEVCTGEMGMGQVKKHDIECWMPGRGGWGETHSCSSFADYQARRSKIRYKKKDGKNAVPFTLNNTAVASPRLIIAIMENFQQEDYSIIIPEVLVPYMNGRKRIGA